ncbi:MAG: hypothetical protein HYR71_01260 [Chloroflexi bacterium]|nr:hypothetical protein [Chloroflexota bacterium]
MPKNSGQATEQTLKLQADVRSLLESLRLTADLPRWMIVKAKGEPYKPYELAALQKGVQPTVAILEELKLLKAKEPSGGWEGIMTSNQTVYLSQGTEGLNRFIASSQSVPLKALVNILINALEAEKSAVEVQLDRIQQDYDKRNRDLLRRQDEAQKDNDLVSRLLRSIETIVGGQLSLSDAVTAWNERERLAMSRDAHRAASEVFARIIAMLKQLLNNLDQLLAETRRARALIGDRVQTIKQALAAPRPWECPVNYDTLVKALSADGADAGLLANLLDQVRQGGGEKLAEHAHLIADQEAARRLARLDIATLIELEAKQVIVDGEAPEAGEAVIAAGEDLLDRVRRGRPSWQLVPGARPRRQVLTLTPHGDLLFEHPELATIAYGDRTDRLGFVEVMWEVAADELQLMQTGQSEFKAAEEKREFFVLEEVSEHWANTMLNGKSTGGTAPVMAPSQPTPPSPNGAKEPTLADALGI